MNIQEFTEYGRAVQVLVGAATRIDVEKQADRLVEGEKWDLCGAILLAATELGARVLVNRLVKAKVYWPLALAGAMRREVKITQMQSRRGAAARRVFRDLDMETDAKAIPDHIQAELDDLQAVAEEARDIADRREAERDADPIRALVVNELAKAMVQSEEAMNALVAIVRASAWEDTRRGAALKLITQPLAMKRLHSAKRVDDLLAVGFCCQLDSAAQTVAETLAGDLEALIAEGHREAVALIAKHHPDPAVREKAGGAG